MDIFLNKLIQLYLNNTINLRHLSQRIISCFYPQNGDRIVTNKEYVTSLHPVSTFIIRPIFWTFNVAMDGPLTTLGRKTK